MTNLEDLKPGLRVEGVVPGNSVDLVAVAPHGPDTSELIYRRGFRCVFQGPDQIVFQALRG